ncbi:uncharacterized protein [Triticum aestivum]|uniref:uncharacterized protein n=1 Tax=Triticum aestivum TaxID=4565 RepID=UPI001D02D92B|nr:uncharacterized protein LOC123116949 [Triticum aestivum]
MIFRGTAFLRNEQLRALRFFIYEIFNQFDHVRCSFAWKGAGIFVIDVYDGMSSECKLRLNRRSSNFSVLKFDGLENQMVVAGDARNSHACSDALGGHSLHLSCRITRDWYELRIQILGHLLTLKENECEDNMCAGVLGFISCIRKTKVKQDIIVLQYETIEKGPDVHLCNTVQ